MSDRPYKYWVRQDFYDHFMRQARDYDFDVLKVKELVFDPRWEPSDDFNGCNLVEDPLQPFFPCFEHDYDWVVLDGGIDSDKKFFNSLRRYGMDSFKAWSWYAGVRLGWIFYYKRKHK